jgi:hypothetical protein
MGADFSSGKSDARGIIIAKLSRRTMRLREDADFMRLVADSKKVNFSFYQCKKAFSDAVGHCTSVGIAGALLGCH